MKKISCILPTYNRKNLVNVRIAELLANDYSNMEIIVVNDGGESLDIEENEVIKVINLTNNSGSVSIPRNIGITHSTGDYICHVDDDVAQHPNKLKTLSNILDNSNTKLCFGQRSEYKNGLLYKTRFTSEWEPEQPNSWGVDSGQFMYRRDVYDQIDLVFCRRACDWHLGKTIRKISEKFISVDVEVCTYTWHDSNRNLDPTTAHRKIYPAQFANYFKWGKIPDEI